MRDKPMSREMTRNAMPSFLLEAIKAKNRKMAKALVVCPEGKLLNSCIFTPGT